MSRGGIAGRGGYYGFIVTKTLQERSRLRKGCEGLEHAHFYAQELGRILAKLADKQAQIASQAGEIVIQLGIGKKFACGGGVFIQLGGSLVQVGAGVAQIIV